MNFRSQVFQHRVAELGGEIYALAKAQIEERAGPRLNLARFILGVSSPGGPGRVNGEDREALEEFARRAGVPFDEQRPIIPFAACRDLSVANAGAGGYLVSTATAAALDALRPWSVTARAGLTIETGLRGNLAVPRTTTKATPYWLTTEPAQLTASTPALSQIVVTPKTAGATVAFSRQLAVQANAEAFVRRELMRTVGTAVDQAVINGSGAAGQPSGILQASGIQTQSGTTLNAGVLTMKRKVAEANVADDRISFISTPAVRELLEGRERATGSGRFVWDLDKVADRPAQVSTDVPASTMLCGDFGNVYFGLWGEGFQLEINPYDPQGFKAGKIEARILVSCDVAVFHPAGFDVATSIT